jgi:hypothetical protein
VGDNRQGGDPTGLWWAIVYEQDQGLDVRVPNVAHLIAREDSTRGIRLGAKDCCEGRSRGGEGSEHCCWRSAEVGDDAQRGPAALKSCTR